MAVGICYLLYLDKEPRQPGDDQGGFLLAVILCIASQSAGGLALGTGMYCEIVGRGERAGQYYCVAETGLRWVAWAQSIAAPTDGGLSLAGFFLGPAR